MDSAQKDRPLRYIKPARLFEAIKRFDKKNSVTRGEFTIDVPGLLADMEWNHMDQLHRPFIHNTYQDNLRIALGRDFAVSLTRWGRLPIFITVADSRVSEGLFYQDMVIAGLIFVHLIISMHEVNEVVSLKIEWTIMSHRFLKPLHGLLSRKFYKLNTRLQEEDSVIRRQRYALRRQGYTFLSDPPNFYNSNRLGWNTIYPPLAGDAAIDVTGLPEKTTISRPAGGHEFLLRREADEYRVWPAVCPHEGARLEDGKLREGCKIECPWHGLKISPVKLSRQQPSGGSYGFGYALEENSIHIRKIDSDPQVSFEAE